MHRHLQRHRPTVTLPAALIEDLEQALDSLDAARAALREATGSGAALAVRRHAHSEVSAAFDQADRLLRQATSAARSGPYSTWRLWRGRLSTLDVAKQRHLFAELDVMGGLGQGSIRTIDTGMAGPAIGDLLHGEASVPGTPARYGLDMDAVLAGEAPATAPLPIPTPAPVLPPARVALPHAA